MGVRGLTTYIAENSELYLKPYELRDNYLVVDGNNILSHLYNWVSKADSAFGGDYDEYYKTVKDFFMMLKKCKVTPVVLFDGGYEKKKLKTAISRKVQKLPVLRGFNKGFKNSKFFPLFIKETFCDVMEELGICCIQCDLEADMEIAAVAKVLNCPVLSYDSDFYIYDVLYIPFSSVYTDPVKDSEERYYVKCSIYDVTNFLSGVNRSLLPILGTLLGNDYIESSVFQKFFLHVTMPKSKNKSYTQRKIQGLLQWLKKENPDSAVKLILSHLEKKHEGKVLQAINKSVEDYTKVAVSDVVFDRLIRQLGDLKLDKRESVITLPPEIIDHFHDCRIDRFIADMVLLQIYFTKFQIEDVYSQSSHLLSLDLIQAIYSVLNPFVKDPLKPLKLYLNVKNHYTAVKVERDVSYNNLQDILRESKESRLKLLYDIVGVNYNDVRSVSHNDIWTIFIIAYMYWINKLNNSVSLPHIHALILMAIANQVIQKQVGYFRNHSTFMKKKGPLLNKLKNTEVSVKVGKDLDELEANVTTYEKLLVQEMLIPYRQTTEQGRGRGYCLSVVHIFACFQSCLFHVMQLNALLNYPLPHLRICDFYSGTLLFNFYLGIKAKGEKFASGLFKDAPNLANLYSYLHQKLGEYSTAILQVKKPPKKKGKKKNKKIFEDVAEEEIIYSEEENEEDKEFNDEDNIYSLLRTKLII